MDATEAARQQQREVPAVRMSGHTSVHAQGGRGWQVLPSEGLEGSAPMESCSLPLVGGNAGESMGPSDHQG